MVTDLICIHVHTFDCICINSVIPLVVMPLRWGFKNLHSLPVSQYRSLHGTAPVRLSSPRCWLAVSSSSTVGDFQPIWCSPVASRNCRRPFIWLCWAKALEQSPWWHYIGFIAVSFQKETENSLIPAIIPGRYFVVCYSFFCRHRGPWSWLLLRPR